MAFTKSELEIKAFKNYLEAEFTLLVSRDYSLNWRCTCHKCRDLYLKVYFVGAKIELKDYIITYNLN